MRRDIQRYKRLAIQAGVGLFLAILTVSQLPAEDWPQHLGPRRDGTSLEAAPAAWSAAGPVVLWKIGVGEGFSAPVVRGGRVFLFHRVEDRERLDCLSATDGSLLWSHAYPTTYRDDFGFDEGPRAAPTVGEDTVFTHGAQGVLTAIDLDTGLARWSLPTHSAFKVRKGFFGVAASPLVEDGRVFLNVGGPGAGVVAFAADDGGVLWQTSDHEASYSSAITAEIGGKRRVLFFTRNGLLVADPASGEIEAEHLWRSRSRSSVNAATPLVFDQRVLLSASYQTGAVLLDLSAREPRPIWQGDEFLSSHYSTSVHYAGHLYGFHGRQEYRPSLRCVELETGEVQWSVDRFGSGTVTRIGERLLIVHEDGRLLLAEASPSAYRVVAEAKILRSVVRAAPAFSEGVLYVRDTSEMVAIRLRQ